MTNRHLSSEVRPSDTGEMSSLTHSVYLNDKKQLNNSMVSPGSMSSLNSYPTSPSSEACQMPVFLPNMSGSLSKAAAESCDATKDPNNDDTLSLMEGNTSVTCAVCNELPLTLQEKLSNQSVGDNCVGDPSAIMPCDEEGVSSGENDQDTERREIVQLEDGTQFSKEEDELREQLGQLKEQLQQCEDEKQQLELGFGERSFHEDKQKCSEKASQSSGTHANEQSKSCSPSDASYDFTEMEGKSGPLQEPGKLNQR